MPGRATSSNFSTWLSGPRAIQAWGRFTDPSTSWSPSSNGKENLNSAFSAVWSHDVAPAIPKAVGMNRTKCQHALFGLHLDGVRRRRCCNAANQLRGRAKPTIQRCLGRQHASSYRLYGRSGPGQQACSGLERTALDSQKGLGRSVLHSDRSSRCVSPMSGLIQGRQCR